MRIKSIVVLFLLSTQSVFATAKIEHWQTSQGTPVYYVQTDGLPMIDIQVVFDAGSARDGYQHGIANLTSALLGSGAGDWNADTIAKRFASVGAIFRAGASRDMAQVSLRSLTEEKWLQKSLTTLQTILTRPAFNEADFQREKNRMLAALKQREESPGELAQLNFFKALYGEHPYAHPTEGNIETVAGFSAQDLQAFYKQYYVASNAMVVIVGDVDKKQAQTIAESLMKGLAIGEKPKPIPNIATLLKGTVKNIQFPSTQTHVLSGLIGMHRKDPDYFSLYVGNHILGGSGLVSQMFTEVREKRGLAYSAYSYFAPLLRDGPFMMGLQTRNDQTTEALQVMQKTLQDFIAQGVSEETLIAAKKNITGGFAMRFDTNSKLMSYIAMIGFYQLPLDYLDNFQQKVEDVTVSSIQDAFKRRVKPELLQTITVGGS